MARGSAGGSGVRGHVRLREVGEVGDDKRGPHVSQGQEKIRKKEKRGGGAG
jgi:hypothetical protein